MQFINYDILVKFLNTIVYYNLYSFHKIKFFESYSDSSKSWEFHEKKIQYFSHDRFAYYHSK